VKCPGSSGNLDSDVYYNINLTNNTFTDIVLFNNLTGALPLTIEIAMEK